METETLVEFNGCSFVFALFLVKSGRSFVELVHVVCSEAGQRVVLIPNEALESDLSIMIYKIDQSGTIRQAHPMGLDATNKASNDATIGNKTAFSVKLRMEFVGLSSDDSSEIIVR
jgi:hypothetical protein